MLNGTFHGGAALGGINACRSKELFQRDVIPVGHDLVQLTFQLPGAAHPGAQPQSSAAAQHLGQIPEHLCHAARPLDKHPVHACQQKDCAHDSTQGGHGFLALFGFFLLFRREVVAQRRFCRRLCLCARPGIGGTEITGIGGVCLLFFERILIDVFQDKQQQPQRPGNGKGNENGNGGDLRKIMLLRHIRTSYGQRKRPRSTLL